MRSLADQADCPKKSSSTMISSAFVRRRRVSLVNNRVYGGDLILTEEDALEDIQAALGGIHAIYKAGFEITRRPLMSD